jgi:hypothetical protein
MSKTGKIILAVIAAVILIPVIGVVTLFVVGYRTYSSARSAMYGEYQSVPVSGGMTADVASTPDLYSLDKSYKYTEAPEGNLRDEKMPATPPSPGSSGAVAANVATRMIIKTGSMSVVVKDVRASIEQISNFTQQSGGFVVSSNISQSGAAPYGTIMIRIPVDKFDMSIGEIKKFGEVVSETTQGEDVTAQYVDLDSQLRNLQATEEQFLTILKQATKIQDILDVQNQLTEVRGQIQSIQGQMKYFRESAQLSSLTISLSTDPNILPVVEKQGDQWKPFAEVKDAARSLLDVGKGLVSIVIWIGVFTPVWGLILIIIIVLVRRMRRKKLEMK